MPAVRTAHGGNARSVAGSREPVMDRGSDLAALDRRLAGTVMPGYQQQDSVSPGDSLLKAAVDGCPGAVEI